MWVKICGTTNLADAQLAVAAGADALGFVFAPSPRRVTPEQVRAITAQLPAEIEKIGVFVDASVDEIAQTLRECGLTGVQLHGGDPALAARLRPLLAESSQPISILQVVHHGERLAARLEACGKDHAIDAVVVDSRSATAVGGTGTRFDWAAAKKSFAHSRLRLIAAGGLSPENVEEAIATLQPWGVDVVSGVESAPGSKDAARVRQFIAKARAASIAPLAV